MWTEASGKALLQEPDVESPALAAEELVFPSVMSHAATGELLPRGRGVQINFCYLEIFIFLSPLWSYVGCFCSHLKIRVGRKR